MISWVEANGVSIRYDIRRGETKRRLLVLLHEAMGMLESWDEALPILETKFDVLRYDQRGFGLSQKTDVFTMDTAVADLNALLDKLAPGERVFLSGCGFGGALSVSFAAKHPDRIAGLFVASPSGTRSPESEMTKQLLVRADKVENLGMESIEPGFFDVSYPVALRGNQQRFELFRLRWLGNMPKQIANLFRAAHKLWLPPILAKIAIPTTIVGCRQDPRAPPEEMKAIAATMPNGSFIEMDTGHFASVQTPEVFAEAAIRQLSKIAD